MKLSELIASVTPVERTVSLALDGSITDRIGTLAEELTKAQVAGEVERAERLYGQIAQAGKAVTVASFTFRQLDPERFAALLDSCPSSDEQRDNGLRFDDKKLRPLVVHESLVEPEPDDFAGFWGRLNWGQQQTLFDAAWSANAEAVDIPFVRAASQITPPSRRTSTTAGRAASPAQSSGGGKSGKSPRTTQRKAKSPATR